MPKLAGRGVLIAALAVPLALAAAPLTASADEPDDVVITDQMVAGAVATDDGAAAMSSETTTTAIEEDEAEYVWYGPDLDVAPAVTYSPYDEDVTEDDAEITVYADEDTAEEVTEEATEEVAEESTEELVEETSTEAVAVAVPVHETSVVDPHHDVVEWEADWVGATYEDVAAYAGADGAWVTSTESGAVSGGHSGLSGSDTAAWYEETTAAAGSDGAFVESTEAAAFESDGWGHGGFHGGDDVTGAMYEHSASGAGEDGAWVEDVESAAFELD